MVNTDLKEQLYITLEEIRKSQGEPPVEREQLEKVRTEIYKLLSLLADDK